MKRYLLNIILVLVISIQAGSVYAKKIIVDGNQQSLPEQKFPFEEGEPWKEDNLKIPPYPDDGDLMELQLDDPSNRFTYYMDEESLAVSEADYVVRYTLVIESKTGARNVFYEGARCNTLEYKTYAFGMGKGSKGKFRPSKNPEWKSIQASGYKKLRMDLLEFYLCDPRKLPRKKHEIVTRIKYPAPNESYKNALNR